MAKRESKSAIDVYADLLDEARERIVVLGGLLDNPPAWPERVLAEFCFLQLRILCEQIALGCVIAHDEVSRTDVLKAWHVDYIFKRLDGLKPQYYPRALDGEFGDGRHHFRDAIRPHLSKNELVTLWKRCGSFLHRGSARALLTGKSRSTFDREEMISSGQKIANLLSLHSIHAASGKDVWIASWSWDQADGAALVWSATATG